MSDYTKGPWNHDKLLPTSIWASGVWIASTNVETIRNIDEKSANARIMAASLELLEALIELRRLLWAEGYADQTPEMAQADAAIAKAEGI